MPNEYRERRVYVLAAALFVCGCQDAANDDDVDGAQPDRAPDAALDGGPSDAGGSPHDAANDASSWDDANVAHDDGGAQDAGHHAGTDAGHHAGADAALEAGTDAATDASHVSEADAEVEVEADASAPVVVVQQCVTFVDRSAPDADRTLSWNLDFGASPERCTQIAAGQSVTWSGSFTFHPLSGLGGDMPSPIPGAYPSEGDHTLMFSVPGTYGFICETHTEMRGAIRVLPL